MKHRLSVSLRLTLWFSGVFLVGFLVFGVLMWFDLAWSLQQGRDKTLAGRARRLITLLENTRNDSPERRAIKIEDFVLATPEGSLIHAFDGRGKRICPPASLTAVDFPWPPMPQGVPELHAETQFEGRHYRVYGKTMVIGSEPVRVLVAGQLEDNRLLLTRFTQGLKWTIIALLALSAFGGYFLSRRALNPVNALIASARTISIGNLSRRLPVSKKDDELDRLAETWNEVLARLEKAVDYINRFTADASHELRSPLTVIRTVSECALRSPHLDPDSAAAFYDIVAESDSAARLLDDMLTLARADANTAEAHFEQVSLRELLCDTLSRIRPIIESKQQTLTEELTADPCRLMGDPILLQRLIRILLDNASKYTPPQTKLEVSLKKAEAEIHLTVRDEGIGIPPADLPRIFERFYRVDPSRGQEEGTGLGLAIAKWIADVHCGYIDVESEQHIGSTFRVVLPVSVPYEQTAELERKA